MTSNFAEFGTHAEFDTRRIWDRRSFNPTSLRSILYYRIISKIPEKALPVCKDHNDPKHAARGARARPSVIRWKNDKSWCFETSGPASIPYWGSLYDSANPENAGSPGTDRNDRRKDARRENSRCKIARPADPLEP